MQFHLPFTVIQFIWIMIFASQLVLLVVLLGRDRCRRFPWFTASIVLSALRLLVAEMLFERMPLIPYNAISLSLACLAVLVSLAVLVELGRLIYCDSSRRNWLISAVGLFAVGGSSVASWGPWPTWQNLNLQTQIGVLRGMQLAAVKGELLVAIVALALAFFLVCTRRGGGVGVGAKGVGGRYHPQRILLGISTYSIALIATLALRQWIALSANSHPLSHAEFERIQDLMERLTNVPYTVLIPVQIWWIYSLWTDEPGTTMPGAEANAEAASAIRSSL